MAEFEWRHFFGAGRKSQIDCLVRLSTIQSGGQTCFLASVKDIGAQKKEAAEKEAFLRRENNVQRMEDVQRLSAGLGHEVNNPLATIVGNLDYLQKEKVFAGYEDCFGDVRGALDRIKKIISTFTCFVGQVQTTDEMINLADLLKRVEELAHIALGDKYRLSLQLDELGLIVWGEQARLEQAVLNLIFNAADAIEQCSNKEIKITLKRGLRDSPDTPTARESKKFATIEVQDKGPGISPEKITKIWQPFYTDKLARGLGLGLPQVVGAAKAHGGFIGLESEIGKGTSVFICLPFAGAEVEEGEV